MDDLNFVLKFQLAGDAQFQIRAASRIKLDGRGGLTYYDVQSHKTETLDFKRLQSFSLLLIKPPLRVPPARSRTSTKAFVDDSLVAEVASRK